MRVRPPKPWRRRLRSCGLQLHRLFAEDGYAPQQPPLAGREVGARVERAAVVPHQNVARAPDMFVHELRLLLVIEEPLQDRIAFVASKTFDLARHEPIDIERLASRG